MYDDILGSLEKDHDSIRAMRRMLADELVRMRREGTASACCTRAILAYAIHDPQSYHNAFEAFLVYRLTERWPEEAPVWRWLNRRHRRLARFGIALQSWLDRIGLEGAVRRHAFVWLARAYIRAHEALLRAEEKRLFPLLRDRLTPGDWVEATTAFEWSAAPHRPRNLIQPEAPYQPEPKEEGGADKARGADSLPRDRTGS